MDKCCGVCKWFDREFIKARTGYCHKPIVEPVPFWANKQTERPLLGNAEGGNCPTYEPKITLDKPHRHT